MFGLRLRQWRIARGITQQALAKNTTLHVGMIRKYEGNHVRPSLQALAALGQQGASLEWLILGTGAPNRDSNDAAEERPSAQAQLLDTKLREITDLANEIPFHERILLLDGFANQLRETKRRNELESIIRRINKRFFEDDLTNDSP